MRASAARLRTPAQRCHSRLVRSCRHRFLTGSRAAAGTLALPLLVFLCFFPIAPAPLAQEGGLRDLVRERFDEPRLRINVGGHTGTVQALAFTPDSRRLCSAGLDKDVHVWDLDAVGRNLQRVFFRQRTIRWQVARGLRGSIYALACAPSDGLLAMGGYGAMGSLGEILLVDPVDGSLKHVLKQHGQTIRSLAFSADGNWLASVDLDGQSTLWRRNGWKPVALYASDQEQFNLNEKDAKLLRDHSAMRPLVILGSRHVVVPYYSGKDAKGRPKWRLVRIGLADRKDFTAFETEHPGMVTALAAAGDGSRMASADLDGNLYLWELGGEAQPERLDRGLITTSLCFSPDGRTLVAGTRRTNGRAKVQVWDVATRRPVRTLSVDQDVFACAVSPDGTRLAYSGGNSNEVFVEPIDGSEEAVPLRGKGRKVWKVAFAKGEPRYRVAFGTDARSRGFNDYADLQESFDTMELALSSGAPLKQTNWLSADWENNGWSVTQGSGDRLQLHQRDVPRGTIELDAQVPELTEGRPRCYCWLPDAQGNPYAIVVGTDLQNSIYVCRLVQQGPCPILRHFRGHHDFVTSVGVSRDLRYVVSGSADGTVRIWSLAGYQQGKAPSGAWGADFAMQGAKLVAAKVHPAGPLFRKGVRSGDVVDEILWLKDPLVQAEKQPEAILRRLRELPWATQVEFRYSRPGPRGSLAAREPFQLIGAWQPLATLFVDLAGEWAFWAPSGYYDASINGHRLFGWQVNRGLDRLPDFYRADQFHKNLERPDAMERLLPSGSLDAAMRRAAVSLPDRLQEEEVLAEQIAATPRVKILSPAPDTLIREDSTKVRARIEVPAAAKLVQSKVIANGVGVTGGQVVEEKDVADGKEVTYEWDVPLPRDETNLIQVVVGTAAPTAAFDNVVIQRDAPPPERPPKMYLLAVGINQYGDPKIRALSYSVADAEAMVDLLRDRSKGLYALDEVTVLTNEKVTPRFWKQSIEKLKDQLAAVARPDDLLVFFLAGHGVVDRKQNYYFVGHELSLDEFTKQDFENCISWADFRTLAEIPCRKLALLDTCHSGAIQPQRNRDLKRAARQLHEDVIFTVTASTGRQKSAEKAQWGHGAFTKCLLEALAGRADDSRDGIVTLAELVSYVKQSVPKLTAGGQTPTAAPDEWLSHIRLPLTHVPQAK